MVASARAFLLELSGERFLSVDRVWMLMGHDTWETQRRAEIIMRLMTGRRVAHDNCPSDALRRTLHQDEFDQQRRVLSANRGHNGGGPSRDRGRGGGSGHGGSQRHSGGGGSSGGGSSGEGGSHRRTGSGERSSGGGGHARRSGGACKRSRGKGGYGHSSSDGHGGHRGHSQGGAYADGSSSSSEDRGKGLKVPIMSSTR